MSTGTASDEQANTFWTREYLLGHCEGYRVFTPDAHVGFVETVMLDPATETTTALIVRACGDFGTTAFPIDRVAEVRTKAEEIVLISPR